MKRVLFSVVLLVLVAAVFIQIRSSGDFTRIEAVFDEASPVLMGVIPYLPPELLRRQIMPVCNYLEQKLNRPVKMVTVSDYESLGQLLELERIHIAWFSQASYHELLGQNEWEILCRPVQMGSVTYTGKIICLAESSFNSVHDLKGRNFAYVDRYSGSGFYYPNLLLAKEGIRPLEFFANVYFTQSHHNSINGVIDGSYDAASVFAGSLNEENSRQLKIIGQTVPIPNDPLVVRKDLDEALKEGILQAMLTMHEDSEGIEHLKVLNELRGTERFVPETEVVKAVNSASK